MTQLLPSIFRRAALLAALAASLLVGGCLEPAAPVGPDTAEDASRFLHRATMGASQADIDRLMSLGYEGWLDEQFDAPPSDNHVDYVNRGGPPGCELCTASGMDAVQEAFWFQALQGRDQLRQRVAFALSELFVISAAANTTLREQDLALASFHTMLAQNAFGNFRDLLENVTLHPAMGVFLSHLQNDKEDPETGRLPDENFAREVMQLFTIGKWKLNQDGTPMLDADGEPLPAYTQADIMGMARVMTGWSWGGGDTSDARWYGYNIGAEDTRQWALPMQPYPGRHSGAEKAIVGGVVIPAGTSATESLRIALDTLFSHPNTGPFVATHLIKRLVTSNPSPGYVGRVAAVFAANAAGERGNMRSVIRAVLFDPEAHSAVDRAAPHWGKLREPVLRVSNYLRAFGAKNAQGVLRVAPLQITPYDLGQTPWMAPTVFNFFTPDHMPAGAMSEHGLTGPEFQIFDEATSVGYVNYLQRAIDNGFGISGYPITVDHRAETALAGDPAALIRRLALLLNGGYVSPQTQAAIEEAVRSIPDSGTNWQLLRVRAAALLLMASPDYLIQK